MKLIIHMESDWHVGEGAGRPGSVDRLVRRHPSSGLPFLPAKTITGVWRDACEAVARGLDGGRPGKWTAWVETIFGSQPALHRGPAARPPRPACLFVGPALFPRRLSEVLGGDPVLCSAVTFVKPGVRIDPASGQALDDHLRFTEMVRGGVSLESEVALDETRLKGAGRETAWALLWAGASVVGRIGGGRRRGAGACRFRAEWPLEASRMRALLASDPPDAEAVETGPPAAARTAAGTVPPRGPAERWLDLPLRLELLSPVAAPARIVGNVVESLPFIPGTLLLGPVTGKIAAAVGEDVDRLSRRGDLRVLNAHPEVGNRRGLPVPLSWFHRKGVESEFVDALMRARLDPGIPWKQARGGFPLVRESREEGGAPVYRGRVEKTDLQSVTHNTVEDESQRPTGAVGGVYTYRALPAGRVLRTVLRVRETDASRWGQRRRDWWEDLKGEIRVGISRKDDYGAVRIVPEGPPAPAPAAAPERTDSFTVHLLSETLLRDEALGWDPGLERLRAALERALGTRLERVAGRGFARVERREGWNLSWGLPRPSLVGLAAGTCAAFRVVGDLPRPEDFTRVEGEGIGERTAEGFGELRFGPFAPAVASDPSGQGTARPRVSEQDGPELHRFARLVETEAWKASIRRICEALAADRSWRESMLGWGKEPGNSQLGGLRQALLSGKLEEWVRRLRESSVRRKRWPGGALDKVLALRDGIWEILKKKDPGGFPEATVGGAATLERELAGYALRSLLTAAIRAHVRGREKEG